MINPIDIIFSNIYLTSPISIIGLLALYYSFIIGSTQVLFCYIGIACSQIFLYLSVSLGWVSLLETWLQSLPILFLFSIGICGYILKQPLQKQNSSSISDGFKNFLLFGFLTLTNPMVFLESSRFLFLGNIQESNIFTFLQIVISGFIINYSLNILFLFVTEFFTVLFPSYKINTIIKNIEIVIRTLSISLILYTFGRYPWRSSHTFFFTPKKLYKPKPERKVGKSLSRLMPYRKVKLYMLKKRQTNPWTTVKQNRKTGFKFKQKRERLQTLYPIINSQLYNVYADNPVRTDPVRIWHQNSRANKPLWLNGFVRVLYLYDRQGQNYNSQDESKNKSLSEGRNYAVKKFYESKTHAGFIKFSYFLPGLKTKTSALNAQFLQETITRPDKYLSSFPMKMYYPKGIT
jgi:hypothetical protein